MFEFGPQAPHELNPAEVLQDINKTYEIFIALPSPTKDQKKLPQGFYEAESVTTRHLKFKIKHLKLYYFTSIIVLVKTCPPACMRTR
jgi:hypothetical protein